MKKISKKFVLLLLALISSVLLIAYVIPFNFTLKCILILILPILFVLDICLYLMPVCILCVMIYTLTPNLRAKILSGKGKNVAEFLILVIILGIFSILTPRISESLDFLFWNNL